MAEFECRVVCVDDVIDHPNADRLTIVKIGGFNCISNKLEDGSWRYNKGDLVVYIPEAAVLPEWLLKQMDFWDAEKNKGALNGPYGDRVKAIKLRGVVSQGVLYPVEHNIHYWVNGATKDNVVRQVPVKVGNDVAEFLGITKYEPPVPNFLAGDVKALYGKTLKFDVENIQKYPDILQENEEVVMSEKLHGTFCGLALYPGLDDSDFLNKNMFAFSKGLGAAGLVFKFNEKNEGNVYVKALVESTRSIILLADYLKKDFGVQPVYVLGEVFGRGIQDLHYGLDKPDFRAFDIYVGEPDKGRFLTANEIEDAKYYLFSLDCALKWVPVLYRGPFDKKILESVRDGKDAISASNVREGVVIRSAVERHCDEIGRVMLKAVSPNYLLRKGNTTEFN